MKKQLLLLGCFMALSIEPGWRQQKQKPSKQQTGGGQTGMAAIQADLTAGGTAAADVAAALIENPTLTALAVGGKAANQAANVAAALTV